MGVIPPIFEFCLISRKFWEKSENVNLNSNDYRVRYYTIQQWEIFWYKNTVGLLTVRKYVFCNPRRYPSNYVPD